MAYKSLLTLLSNTADADLLLMSAGQLAEKFDAHLDVICLGIDEVQMGYYFAGADAVLQQQALNLAHERSVELTKHAKAVMAKSDLRYAVHGAVMQFGALNDMVAEVARFADLVVLPKPYGETASPEKETILEAALFSAHAPVLVVPEEGIPEGFGGRVLVGWNAGNEALRAIRAALPMLQHAERTNVAVVDPPAHSPSNADPGQAVSTLLDRHGVQVEISVLAKTLPRISEVLFNQARDIDASLIVAGAYGHSRLRQSIMGGATRDLLTKSEVPLLLAH